MSRESWNFGNATRYENDFPGVNVWKTFSTAPIERSRSVDSQARHFFSQLVLETLYDLQSRVLLDKSVVFDDLHAVQNPSGYGREMSPKITAMHTN